MPSKTPEETMIDSRIMEAVEPLIDRIRALEKLLTPKDDQVFEYPLFKKRSNDICQCIFKFTGLTSYEVVEVGSSCIQTSAYMSATDVTPHTDSAWKDCEKPKWTPAEPTWCKVWDDDNSTGNSLRLVVAHTVGGYKSYSSTALIAAYDYYTHAAPCEEKDIPQWWKDMKGKVKN